MEHPAKKIFPQEKIHLFWWAAILSTALLVRLPFALDPGLTGDEVNYVLIARCSARDILSGAALDPSNPPLFMLLLHYLMELVGEKVWAWKMLPMVLNISAIALMVALFSRWVPAGMAVLAGLLAAIHPWQVYMATEVRGYALAGLLAVVVLEEGDRYVKEHSVSALVSWALACAAGFWTHYGGAVAALVSGIYIFVLVRRQPRRILALVLAGTASICLMMLWLPNMLTQTINTGGEPEHLWHLAGLPLVHCLGTTFLRPEVEVFLMILGGTAAAVVFGFAGIQGFFYLLRENRPVLVLLVGLFAASVAVPLVRSGLVGGLAFSSRYTFIANITPILLVACGLAVLRLSLGMTATVGILGLSLVSLGLFRWVYQGRSSGGEIVARTLARTGDAQTWLFPNMVTAMRARFYGNGGFPIAFVRSRDPGKVGIVGKNATWLDVADSKHRTESFFDRKSLDLLRSYDTVWYWSRHSADLVPAILGPAFVADRVIAPISPGGFGAERPPIMVRFRKITEDFRHTTTKKEPCSRAAESVTTGPHLLPKEKNGS